MRRLLQKMFDPEQEAPAELVADLYMLAIVMIPACFLGAVLLIAHFS